MYAIFIIAAMTFLVTFAVLVLYLGLEEKILKAVSYSDRANQEFLSFQCSYFSAYNYAHKKK